MANTNSSHRPTPSTRTNGNPTVSRRTWIGIALGGAASALVGARRWTAPKPSLLDAGATPATVYASPTCGCCHKWMEYLERNGFKVTDKSMDDVTPIKASLGVPEDLRSCHTAVIKGYIVEGHVPADLIQKMLKERPAIAGLAAPGMPSAAPGMDLPMKESYKIIAFTKTGKTSVYAVR